MCDTYHFIFFMDISQCRWTFVCLVWPSIQVFLTDCPHILIECPLCLKATSPGSGPELVDDAPSGRYRCFLLITEVS